MERDTVRPGHTPKRHELMQHERLLERLQRRLKRPAVKCTMDGRLQSMLPAAVECQNCLAKRMELMQLHERLLERLQRRLKRPAVKCTMDGRLQSMLPAAVECQDCLAKRMEY